MSNHDAFDLADYVRRSCAASGVPERLEDPGAAAVIAGILDVDGEVQGEETDA